MPRNENPLEKQLLHLDLSKGCNERDRPETADPTSTLSRMDNLTQDQTGAYIKRYGTPFLGGTANDDTGTLLLPAKLIRTRESLAAIDSSGKYFQYQEAVGLFRQRGQVPDFTVKSDLVVGSGPVVSPTVYSSSTNTSFHVLVHSAGLDTGAGNPSIYLTIYDRNSGSIVAQYDLRSVSGASALSSAQAVIVDDRYVHCYVGSSTARSVFVIDTLAALPANESAIALTSVSASSGGIIDVSAGAGRSYVMYAIPSGATSVSAVTNALSVTTAASVLPNTQTGLQISYSGTKLWFLGSVNMGALDPTTLAASVASAAHGGPTNGYMAVDASDVVWCANETSTALGGTTITTVQFRKTPSANTTTFSAVHANLDAWKIAGTPFVIQSSKVYVHLLKDSTFTVTPHVVVPMDPTIMATPTYRGVQYNSVRIAAAPETHIGVANASVLRILTESGISGTNVGLAIAVQTTQRASGYCIYELSSVGFSNIFSQNYGGLTYMSGGCPVSYDGGDQPVEVGFVDLPRADAAASVNPGVPNGSYKYIAVFRCINASGSVSWSRVSPVAPATVVSKIITVNVTAPSVTLHDHSKGATQVPINISVELYRTTSGGTNYYLVASSQAGTPASGLATAPMSLSGGTRFYRVGDNMSDVTLISQPLLFRQPGTSNSALDRYPPPAGNVLCQHKDRLFTSDPNGLRVYYSSFFVDGETAWFNPLFSFLVHGGSGPITGIVSMDGRLFVFKRDGIFVVDGDGPAEGGVAGNEFSPPQRLATEYGCVDQRSICVTTDGVIYRSSRGIEILTRSLQVKWIGDRVQNTVDANTKTCGVVLDTSGQVHVALSAAATSNGIQTVSGAEVVYDFTTDSWNVYTHTSRTGVANASLQDICMANINGSETVCVADPYGGVCGSSFATGLDRGAYYVGWTVETVWLRTGQQARQRVSKAMLLAKKRAGSNHAIKMSLAYDYLDTYTETYTWQPSVINPLAIEQLEMLMSKPQNLAVRVKFEEIAPSDTITYPVGLGAGADVLGVAAELAPKQGMPSVSVAQKGLPSVLPAPTVTSITPSTGADTGGTAITNLAGTGFVNGATVKIGGVACTSVVFVSSTKLTCVTPAGADGAQTVTVTNPDIQTGSLAGGFTYTALVPTLTSLNYSQGNIAGGGQSIVATGTNCSGVTSVTILGNSVAPTSTTPTTVTFTLPAHAAGVGTVALVSPGGTSGTLPFEYWNPAVLTPKLWVHDYAGAPWTNSGSVADTLVSFGSAPTVGTSVNGHTPASFNGTTQAMRPGTNFESAFLTTSDGTAIVLTNPASAVAPAANFYDDPTPLQGLGGNWGISFTSSGAEAGIFTGSNQVTSRIACATGVWHLLAARWTGSALKFRMDQTDATPAAGVMSGSMAGDANVMGRNYNGAAYYSGDMLEIFETQSSISDADLTKYRLYVNQWYGLSI